MKQRKHDQGYVLMTVLLVIVVTSLALSSALKKSRNAVLQANLAMTTEVVQAKVEAQLANLQTAVEKNLKSVIQSQSSPTTIVGTSGSPTYSILNPSGFSGTGVTFQVVCYQEASSPTCTTNPANNPKYFKISYSFRDSKGVSYSLTKYFQSVVKTTTTGATPAASPRPLGTFGTMSGIDLGIGASPNFMASGDVNGDGNPDIITAQENGYIKVLLGNGSGGFTVSTTNIQPGSSVGSVALFDHDGNGKLDLFATHKGSNTVWYYPGVGDGTFTSPWSLPNTASTSGGRIFAANFSPTNDTATAKTEFVLTSTGTTNSTAIWGRTGTGAQIANTGTIAAPWGITNQVDFVDFNKDGFLDLVGAAGGLNSEITAGTATGLTALAASTRPPYRPPARSPYYPPGAPTPTPAPTTQAVVTGDFNKDGCPDVVEAQQSGSAILTPRFGNCTNTITAFTVGTSIVLNSTTPSQGGAWLNAKDFDSDGYLDIVSTNPNAGTITVVKGAASGAFGTPTSYSMGAGSLPQMSLTIDVNRDGILDIVTCNKGTNSIGVSVQNTSGAASAGSAGTTTYSMSSKAMYLGRGKSTIDDALSYLPR